MLHPSIVGDIAHGHATLRKLDEDGARTLIRHDLAYAAYQAFGSTLDESSAGGAVLRRAAHDQSLHSVSVAATATRVSEILGNAYVRAIVYKGPPLAAQTTGSWLGRASVDVDVLIDPADLPATDRALRTAGCVSRSGQPGAPAWWERYHRPERAYRGLPVTVDLHWRVDAGPGYFTMPFAAAWSRAEHIVDDGLDVMTFDRLDALLVTAVHGAKERWWRWFWALDAVRQIEQLDASQLPSLQARARSAGAWTALRLCFAIAANCGGHLPRGTEPEPKLIAMAQRMLAQSAQAGAVDWGSGAAWSRRRARWAVADSPVAAAGGFARAVARLVADRRAPGSPQHRHE